PLPPSMRRKTACVIPGVLLTLALAPVVPSLVAVAAAVVGLVVLVYSFGVDGVWLWSTRTR
ncbi:MAG: CDP-alcohol phosphatidyltransferase family protein, partial [Ectothiorhodospiraceae bacterium]